MNSNSLRFRASVAIGATAALLLMAACAGSSPSSVASAQTHFGVSGSPGFKIDKKALLHPTHKYFGLSLAGVPKDVTTPITKIKNETGKRPNLIMYFQDWGKDALIGKSNFNTTYAENACAAGMLPMYTWESWNTSKTTSGQGSSYTQGKFNMLKIIRGKFDTYIKKTADLIASIHCPIAIRFDQEQNGYWYPWGLSNTDENGTNVKATAKEYIAMWRHVRRIFKREDATNVLWLWSPNIQGKTSKILPPIGASYPGAKWVDWVGIDGYYNTPSRTFTNLLGPIMTQLATVAPKKPWILAETGVGSSHNKAKQIKNLLNSVLRSKRLNGLVYFEQHKSHDRNFWPFVDPSYPNSLAAFKTGIDQKGYATGRANHNWYVN